MPAEEPVRFADVLTTAAAVANYRGEADVRAGHVLDAIAILRGQKSLEELGRAVSPLVRRAPPGQAGGVEPALRALVQRWHAAIGGDAAATLDDGALNRLTSDLTELEQEAHPGGG